VCAVSRIILRLPDPLPPDREGLHVPRAALRALPPPRHSRRHELQGKLTTGFYYKVNMDRGSIWRRLTQAEERISRGTEHVWKQREIVEKLERRGRNSDQARKVLKSFEDSLSAQQAGHHRLLLEIEH